VHDLEARASQAPRPAAVSDVPHRDVLGMRVDATSYARAAELVAAWSADGRPRYVGVACVNNVMQANDEPSYMDVMNGADLVVPDGRPLVWALRAFGIAGARQVRGTYLTAALLRTARDRGLGVAVVGGTPDVLERFRAVAERRWPGIDIAYATSPPFRPLSEDEDRAIVDAIHASGARIVLVALGCPKQEQWMYDHRDSVRAVMVGVGAAIDFIAGTKRQAPALVQRLGVEWLFRLASEPRRLWRRYLTQNPRFALRMAGELIRGRRRPTIDRRTA
jgi:N-acetylglucosaminyldiphosphoundecaprenol N-acetyl-beta-D-mannosaminyltransferase